MSKLAIPFYNNNQKPNTDELVLVKFSERTDTHFNGELIEYNCKAFMVYSDASKKKKVFSWNKIVPLNKEIFGRVEEVEENSNIVKVSICKDQEVEQQDQINKNKILLSIIKKLSFEYKKDLNDLWTQIIYKLDEKRRNDNEDEIPILLDYFAIEKDFVKNICNDDEIYNKLYELIDKFTQEKPCKLISKFDIISTGEIGNTLSIFKKVLDNIKFPYTLKYESAPTYIFESNSLESSFEDHNKLIFTIKEEGQKYNPKTFLKYSYEVTILEDSIKIINFRLPYSISADELCKYLKESKIDNILNGTIIKNHGSPDMFLINISNKKVNMENCKNDIIKALDKMITNAKINL
jgi:translation initiation factor 2 alpha subunit (eIF-2alpha)